VSIHVQLLAAFVVVCFNGQAHNFDEPSPHIQIRRLGTVTTPSLSPTLAPVAPPVTSASNACIGSADTASGARMWRTITSSSDGQKLAAGTACGTTYTSADGGLAWTKTNAGSRQWVAIASSSSGSVIVAADYDYYNHAFMHLSIDSGLISGCSRQVQVRVIGGRLSCPPTA